VIKEVAQSYLTSLWNRQEETDTHAEDRSFVHLLSRYFTWIVFGIAILAAAYWYFHDPSKIAPAVTAVLIVACPCALLLSNTFTNANILRRLGRNQLYLRNAQVIEDIASADCIVFDKTGTLTSGRYQDIQYEGAPLSRQLKKSIGALAAQSTHPLSKAIASWAGGAESASILAYREIPGKGIEGIVSGDLISLGSASFVTHADEKGEDTGSQVFLSVEEEVLGKFIFRNHYRSKLPELISHLSKNYQLAVLSGDNAGEKTYLSSLLGPEAILLFNQQPADKLEAIRILQAQGRKVMMIGDGLNDAGALRQADIGMAVSENNNNFTPASDAILAADKLPALYRYIRLCKANKSVIVIAFGISILYNIIGLFFAVQGVLSPIIAAILMPCSSISILLITYGMSNYFSNRLGLK
jgi:P-type Cu+ transporter